MAHELGGFSIRVNTISPGPIYTEVERATVSPEQKKAMQAAQCLHRDGVPDDLVGVVAFLLSNDSAYISGQTLHVNGGLIHR
jgi:NAD(P)-dependent dehydrogenase (short-subunit alcohol dehydrogenase family)